MSSAGGGQAGYGYGNSHGQGSGFGIRSNTDASGNSRLRDALRSLDHHSSVSAEFRVRTSSGGGFSVLTVLVIAYLLRVEYTYNLLRTTVRDHVHVNATSPAGLDLEFDLTFPFLPCALLSVDAHDPTGQSQSLHLDRTHHVWKHRLSSGGQPIGKKSKYELGSTLYEEDHFRGVAESLGLQILEGEALEAKRRADARYAEIDYGNEGEEEEVPLVFGSSVSDCIHSRRCSTPTIAAPTRCRATHTSISKRSDSDSSDSNSELIDASFKDEEDEEDDEKGEAAVLRALSLLTHSSSPSRMTSRRDRIASDPARRRSDTDRHKAEGRRGRWGRQGAADVLRVATPSSPVFPFAPFAASVA